MIHQGTPVCCATAPSGDTDTVTWKENKTPGELRPRLHVDKLLGSCGGAYVRVGSSQDHVFSLSMEDEGGLHHDVQVWGGGVILCENKTNKPR